MLKQLVLNGFDLLLKPAAFRRLCVETVEYALSARRHYIQPPSGGCVLKPYFNVLHWQTFCPAAFRRLCVETCNIKQGVTC